MRKVFFEMLKLEMVKSKEIVVLTADMGYGLLDSIRKEFPDRFVNFGSSEQLMVGAATGMAMEGKIPVCYSITPFLLYRPFEFIRNYMNHEQIPIKLVGGGRNKDYGNLGFTHHAEDDIEIMSRLPNIFLYKPADTDELKDLFIGFIYDKFPSYLNLTR